MGMFDVTPDQVPLLQQQADTQQAMNAANLPEGRGGVYAASIAGNMLGRGIAGAMGYQDPRMAMAQKMQDAMNETNASGIDFATNPVAYYGMAAKNLAKRGLYDQAFAAQGKVKEASQAGLEQAQTAAALKTATQQDAAEKRVAFILTQTGGDRNKAAQMMAMDANPLVQKRGEELSAKRYTPATEWGNIDNFSPDGKTIVGGANGGNTELGKYQTQLANINLQLKTSQDAGHPQAVIDGLTKTRDELQGKIDIMTKGSPHNSSVERSNKTLTGILKKKLNNEPLTQDDYLDAIAAQGSVESQTHAVVGADGTTVFVQNTVDPRFSVNTLFGNNVPSRAILPARPGVAAPPQFAPQQQPPQQPMPQQGMPPQPAPQGAPVPSGVQMPANPVPGTVTQNRVGNAIATTIQGPGARPSEAEMKVLSQSDALSANLKDMQASFDPDFVGPVAGRVGAFTGATIGNSEKREKFIAQNATYKDRMIQLITGAAMGVEETKRLLNEIPDVNDPPERYVQKVAVAQKNLDYVTRAYQTNMRQGGVRVVGGNDVSGAPMVRAGPAAAPQGQPLPPQGGRLQAPPDAHVVGGARFWQHEGRLYRQNPDGTIDSRDPQPAGK